MTDKVTSTGSVINLSVTELAKVEPAEVTLSVKI